MSFVISDLVPAVRGWVAPLRGALPYNKKAVEEQQKESLRLMGALEQHLLIHTFLVGERITLADIFAVGLFTSPFKTVSMPIWCLSIRRFFELRVPLLDPHSSCS